MIKVLFDAILASNTTWGNVLSMCGFAAILILFSVLFGILFGFYIKIIYKLFYRLFKL